MFEYSNSEKYIKTNISIPYEKKVTVYVLTVEDMYETEFGDGEYQDIEQCFWNLEDAKQVLIEKRKETPESVKMYRIKTINLSINNDKKIILIEKLPLIYETLTVKNIIKSLDDLT